MARRTVPATDAASSFHVESDVDWCLVIENDCFEPLGKQRDPIIAEHSGITCFGGVH